MDMTLPLLVAKRAAEHPHHVILRRKARGIWQPISWAQLADQVRRLAGSLHAGGLQPGDGVAILSETRPEAVYADLAAQSVGGAAVAIHPDTEPPDVASALKATRTRIVFVENEEQLDKVLSIRGQCPLLSRIVIFDMRGLRDFADSQCVSLADFEATPTTFDLAQANSSFTAAIMQPPSGPMQTLTQREVTQALTVARQRLALSPRDERIALLNMSDPVERIWGLYASLDGGCVSGYLESADTAAENLAELQPTVLGCNAMAWTHFHSQADRAARDATAPQRLLYGWSIRAARRGNPLAHPLVLRAVRRKLGLSRLRLAYTGGEPVPAATLEWVRSLRVTIQRIEDAGPIAPEQDGYAAAVMQSA